MTVAHTESMKATSRTTARGSFLLALGALVAFGMLGCGSTGSAAGESAGENASAAGAAPWGASYVSQSFPLATTTLKMKAGQVLPSYIELKNSGTSTWDSKTKIGTTEPRDRASAFADSTWSLPSRASAVTGTVAPGGTFKFIFDLRAPATPGTYDEFFGVVEEGVVWFGDPGQGGPIDSDLEVKIEVSAADPGPDAGAFDDDAGADDGGPISVSQIPTSGDDAGPDPSHAPVSSSNDEQDGTQPSSCNLGKSSRSSDETFFLVAFAVVAVAANRRRSKRSR